jgi:site-specific DNA-methyltransferase (adenine-specific)|tara:strand:- start:72 stop:647 length:576 start_codon:yes stop_codon:yes gene_type:complete
MEKSTNIIPLPDKKYNIIYADPPWHYGSKSAINNTSGKTIKPLEDHYNTMTLNELKELPIKELTKEDAACFMWVTDSHIDEALEILKSWGFKYKTIAFNWVKTTSKGNYCKNVAPWTMKSSEICLLGIKGKMTKYKQVNNIESLVIAERTKHSRKPKEVRDRIELLFGDTPRIELFAREKTEGWDSWGNEI